MARWLSNLVWNTDYSEIFRGFCQSIRANPLVNIWTHAAIASCLHVPCSLSPKHLTLRRVRCRSQWPRVLKRGSTAARLLGLWVRIPPVAWMPVCCECCVLSDRGLSVGLITRPEESNECGVSECDCETSIMRKTWPTGVSGIMGGGGIDWNTDDSVK